MRKKELAAELEAEAVARAGLESELSDVASRTLDNVSFEDLLYEVSYRLDAEIEKSKAQADRTWALVRIKSELGRMA